MTSRREQAQREREEARRRRREREAQERAKRERPSSGRESPSQREERERREEESRSGRGGSTAGAHEGRSPIEQAARELSRTFAPPTPPLPKDNVLSISQTSGAGLAIDPFGFSTTPQRALQALNAAPLLQSQQRTQERTQETLTRDFGDRLNEMITAQEQREAQVFRPFQPFGPGVARQEFEEEHERALEQTSLSVLRGFAAGDNPMFITTETFGRIGRNFASQFPPGASPEEIANTYGYVEIVPGVWVPGETTGDLMGSGGTTSRRAPGYSIARRAPIFSGQPGRFSGMRGASLGLTNWRI